MASRRMAAQHERPPEPRQFARRHAHLRNDVVHAHLRAEIVAWNGNVDTMGVQPSRAMAERGAIQRLPIAAMDEDDDRTLIVAGKDIDRVAGARRIRDRARGMLLAI